MYTLSIDYKDLTEDCRTAKTKTVLLKSSNILILNEKLNDAYTALNMFIEGYNMTTPQGTGGNTGINAGAYLHDWLDEDINNL